MSLDDEPGAVHSGWCPVLTSDDECGCGAEPLEGTRPSGTPWAPMTLESVQDVALLVWWDAGNAPPGVCVCDTGEGHLFWCRGDQP